MHIPDNYLSPATCAVLTTAMVPVWARAVKKVKTEITKEKMPLLGVGAAFSFLGMMFNLPLPGGTTGHAVGGTLIALMLGPNAACIAVSIALFVQALLFGDGGILAFGANCFNMAFVLPYLGYGIYQLLAGHTKSEKGKLVAAGIGAYAGINAAALCAAVEFGIQPLIYTDASGQALYCPYPLSVSVPAMMIGHLTIAGLAEVIFTVAVYSFVKKTSPGMLYQQRETKVRPVWILLLLLIVAVPLGLLATGTAWGEWGADEIAQIVTGGKALGYTPDQLANGFSFDALFPDYTIGNMPEWIGYILSAVAGVAVVVIIFKVAASFMKNTDKYDQQDVSCKQ
ncbi:MAG: cobalt transporter CbiM [Lachnospiraceae bacterium]|nr:cobalt transporter CbiM [Lachnospiraceae bacterium]